MDNIVAISVASLCFLEYLIITTFFVISEETTATNWCLGFFLLLAANCVMTILIIDDAISTSTSSDGTLIMKGSNTPVKTAQVRDKVEPRVCAFSMC